MKKKRFLLLLLLFSAFPAVYLTAYTLTRKAFNEQTAEIKQIKGNHPEEVKIDKDKYIGEKITYAVKLGKVNLGTAVYEHLPQATLDGKKVNQVTFETRMAKFYDLERIYSDPENFLPLKVERDVRNWPFSQKITEYYNQDKFSLVISTDNKGKSRTIQKKGHIHNSVILPFYVRRQEGLMPGWSMTARLPNQDFEIRLVGIEDIDVPAGNFKAYRFDSQPEKFEIWVSADERRIPLRIKSSAALGYTLLLKEYEHGQARE